MIKILTLIGERHSVKEQTLWYHIAQDSPRLSGVITPSNFTTEVIKSSFIENDQITSFLNTYNQKVWEEAKIAVYPKWQSAAFPKDSRGEDIHGFAYFNLSLLQLAKRNGCTNLKEVVEWLYGDHASLQFPAFEAKMQESLLLLSLFQKEVMNENSVLDIDQLMISEDNPTNQTLQEYKKRIENHLQSIYGKENFELLSTLYEKEVSQMNKIYRSYSIMYRDLFMYDKIRTAPEHIQFCSVGYGHARNILKIHEMLHSSVKLVYLELL